MSTKPNAIENIKQLYTVLFESFLSSKTEKCGLYIALKIRAPTILTVWKKENEYQRWSLSMKTTQY